MQTQTIAFNLAEKLALVNAIDSVIVADEYIHEAELTLFSQLMKRIDFDSNFIIHARNITTEQSLTILKAMSEVKKNTVAEILNEVAKVDGFVHKKEVALILGICEAVGIRREVG